MSQPEENARNPNRMRRFGAWLLERVYGHGAARAAVASFAVVILAGALLLTLPASSRSRTWTSPVDCLFTATSAVCVTGLIVRSTPDHWSLFGQVVILALIQTGGLGIMTLGAFTVIFIQRRLSLRFESVMTDIVETRAQENVWTLIRFICLFTLVVEVAGAALLFFGFGAGVPPAGRRLWHSVFHSISAFCNAGFSLNNDSLVGYVDNVTVNLVVAGQIVLGGIGFVVVRDVLEYVRWWVVQRRGRRPKLSTHSKLVLTVTGVLIVGGMVAFLVVESYGSLSEAPWKTRVLASMFQSVTPRTAGFNTVPTGLADLAPATAFLLMVLMYIGGSPGSTAGGIKTSTLGIMVASIIATLRGRDRAEMFHHTVPAETVHRVASIILLSVAVLVVGVFLLLISEAASFQLVVFEAVSAFGTVGLSQGLSGPATELTAAGKLVVTVLMFAGRLGPVTLVLSVARLRDRSVYSYPEDRILVG